MGRLAALVLALAVLGCSRQSPQAPSNYLRLSLSEDPITLDPAYITDVNGGAMAAKIFDGLVQLNREGNILPCLAESWRVEDGGKRYVFSLRENVFFHHGRQLEAADIGQSFRRLLAPETASPRRWVLSRIQDIRIPDKKTVVLTLAEPFAPFLYLLAMPNAAVIPVEEAQRLGKDFGRYPVGTGPFALEHWQRDERLLLKKNPRYFRPAHVDGVEYRILPEGWANVTEFKQGRLDWIAVPPSHMDEVLQQPAQATQRLLHRIGLNTYYLGFNCQKAPLNNPKIRRALAMALDREKIVQTLLKQRAVPAQGPLPPALSGPPTAQDGVPYDPAKAKQWLQEEGAQNLHLTLYQASSQEALEIMEALQDYWSRIGLRVDIVQREWSSFKEAVLKGEADMFFLSWWADYPAAENFLFPNFYSGNAGAGGNKTRFADGAFDELILEASRQTDEALRRQLYGKAEQRVLNLSPWIFLWHRQDWVLVQPWVRDWELSAVYNADKLNGVRLERPAA